MLSLNLVGVYCLVLGLPSRLVDHWLDLRQIIRSVVDGFKRIDWCSRVILSFGMVIRFVINFLQHCLRFTNFATRLRIFRNLRIWEFSFYLVIIIPSYRSIYEWCWLFFNCFWIDSGQWLVPLRMNRFSVTLHLKSNSHVLNVGTTWDTHLYIWLLSEVL